MSHLSIKQHEYIESANHRWNLKVGAVRSGKSFVDIDYTIPSRLRAVRNERGLNLILGVSKETIERNVLQPMRERYTERLVGTINNRNIARVCGVDVYCLGAEKITQVAKLQGMSVKYCYGDEIAKWNKDVFEMLKSRLDKPYSRFDGACNPENPSHWLKEFIDKPEIDKYVQHYTIYDNPFLPKDYVENLCKEYEGTVYYGRYIKGEWTLAEGLIYPMYADAIAEPPNGQAQAYILSIDYGTQNAFSCGLWGKYGDIWYRVKEYYYSGRNTGVQKTDEEYAADLDNFIKDVPIAERIRTIIDPSAASFITLLKKRGKYHVVPAKNDVADGIRETATAMKKGLIKVSPDCKNWCKEVQGYVWDTSSAEDKPVKIDDHCLTGDTMVDTSEGQKPIKDLVGKSGLVWSYNTEIQRKELKPFHDVRMTRKNAKTYKITTDDGRIIRCTSDHPILTERGYVLAKDLLLTDKIVCI